MRTIKFKLWSKRDGWCGGFCVHQSGLISTVINAEIIEPQHMAVADAHWKSLTDDGEYILCQFTGLLDKNGKEIYEGDVIKSIILRYPKEYTVVYSRSSFVLKENIPDDDIRISMDDSYEMDIIGNIYENPDLLN